MKRPCNRVGSDWFFELLCVRDKKKLADFSNPARWIPDCRVLWGALFQLGNLFDCALETVGNRAKMGRVWDPRPMPKHISNRVWTRIGLGFGWLETRPRTDVAELLARPTMPMAELKHWPAKLALAHGQFSKAAVPTDVAAK